MTSRARTGRGTTFGGFAFASLLVVAVSGVILALPFDAHKPYDSVALLLLGSPGARVARNVHYLAAQAFLLLMLLHTWDHLRRSTERRLSAGMWARVTLSLPLVAYLMLSGFILKGDPESAQALRIVSAVTAGIPLVGRSLAFALFGNSHGGDLQVVYLHHIATATVLAWLIVAEHARATWPRAVPTITTFVVTGALGLFLSPTLHDGLDPIVRGPWYFLGLQELLHWAVDPRLLIGGGCLFLCAVWWLPRLRDGSASRLKAALALALVGYAALTVFAFLCRGENWTFAAPSLTRAGGIRFEPALGGPAVAALRGRDIPVVLGRREGCLYCHANLRGLSPSHRADAVGCASCHAGNPFSLDKTVAHANMILVPGNLSVAARTCGLPQCHADTVTRVGRSIMTTMAGVVSVDRAVLEGSEGPKVRASEGPKVRGSEGPGTADVRALGRSPADTHLRQLCASCHLSNAKQQLGPITESTRGGGCNACHLNYSREALDALGRYQRGGRAEGRSPTAHPDVSIDIADDHCFGCHSRSGRISTSYQGWMERAPGARDVARDVARDFSPATRAVARDFSPAKLRTLDDGRVFSAVTPDVHFEKGMRCVDCHTAREVMGDGVAHARKSAQVRVACADCHVAGQPRHAPADRLDAESRKILSIRDGRLGRPSSPGPFLSVANGGEPLLNTTFDAAGVPRLAAKQSGSALELRRPAAGCVQGGGHARLSCVSCHGAWAPRCAGCHTRFDSRATAYDHVAGGETKGAWVEEASDFEAAAPALGVRSVRDASRGTHEVVDTFLPGMTLTIAPGPRPSGTVFHRLYARAFSHTVSKGSRSCDSCHNDPVALGYGAGSLRYESVGSAAAGPPRGRWVFTPARQLSPYDRLPTDAWIGFLEQLAPGQSRSTRDDVRPFTIEEQKRILTVGACLTCHKGDSPVMRDAIGDFRAVLRQATRRCTLPAWP